MDNDIDRILSRRYVPAPSEDLQARIIKSARSITQERQSRGSYRAKALERYYRSLFDVLLVSKPALVLSFLIAIGLGFLSAHYSGGGAVHLSADTYYFTALTNDDYGAFTL